MRLWLILQITNNPVWLNQTDCVSRDCDLWTPFPGSKDLHGVHPNGKPEAGYFRIRVSWLISESLRADT